MLLDTNLTGFCSSAVPMLKFVGYAILIFKIAIPIIIVVLGMMDFGKAVISEKDDDIKKQAVKLGRRVLAGIVIFFIPTIIEWLFGTVDGATNSDLKVCSKCILDVTGGECKEGTPETPEH